MRERPPVPAHERFIKSAADLRGLPLEELFTVIHDTNMWGSASRSGIGSELDATATLRSELPALLKDLGVESLLDIPCGDFGWLSQVELGVRYTGADIVPSLVERNRAQYGGEFLCLDLCSGELPRADAILCRDCLVHLSFSNVRRAVENLRRSGSTWLLTTHFVECEENRDIENGDWRMLNFTLPPFEWPAPERVLLEGCTESGGGYPDKSLALWRIADLPL